MEVAHRSVNINYKNAFNDERKNGATVDQQYVVSACCFNFGVTMKSTSHNLEHLNVNRK